MNERGSLEANRLRRETAEAELRAAQRELRELLVSGARKAVDVAELARRAGISRETVYKHLRAAGEPTRRQRDETRRTDAS